MKNFLSHIRFNKKVFFALGFLLILIPAGVLWYRDFSTKQDVLSEEAPEDEMVRMINTIGKVMLLPEGESPSVAIIDNTNEFKNNPFLSQAQPGDRLIIYYSKQKAILYRPSIQKIVDVTDISKKDDASFTNPLISTESATLTPTGVKKNAN